MDLSVIFFLIIFLNLGREKKPNLNLCFNFFFGGGRWELGRIKNDSRHNLMRVPVQRSSSCRNKNIVSNLSVCPSVRLSVCPSGCKNNSWHNPMWVLVQRSFSCRNKNIVSVCHSVRLSKCRSVGLSVCHSVPLSICAPQKKILPPEMDVSVIIFLIIFLNLGREKKPNLNLCFNFFFGGGRWELGRIKNDSRHNLMRVPVQRSSSCRNKNIVSNLFVCPSVRLSIMM